LQKKLKIKYPLKSLEINGHWQNPMMVSPSHTKHYENGFLMGGLEEKKKVTTLATLEGVGS